ncbi:4-hydroxyphenylpyruvate dioxygenase [Amphibiibacter pelophylacis]|uniref:4-hydroxyphenylpyruvate dioxygenase n=1 Tax=Amphibiibacter pelophylacis TaxID=1799477 RepID=A0ACC6P0H4_9BURK
MSDQPMVREDIPSPPNPLGMDGIEFVEYATHRPQALGQVLEAMGFCPVARHRSREVTLYRQGGMNLVVNASPDDSRVVAARDSQPVLSAVAFRVQDAQRAHAHCLDLGAWDVPSHARGMELHIPAIQGPGGSRFYWVDRWRDFSIFDIDFVPIPGVDTHPPAIAGMDYFGLVQYVGLDRASDWQAWYGHLLGFTPLPDDERFGILPKGRVLRSPCHRFFWQLIEPETWGDAITPSSEYLQRIGLGTHDVSGAVQALQARGVRFVEAAGLRQGETGAHGALTRGELGGVAFELVRRPEWSVS